MIKDAPRILGFMGYTLIFLGVLNFIIKISALATLIIGVGFIGLGALVEVGEKKFNVSEYRESLKKKSKKLKEVKIMEEENKKTETKEDSEEKKDSDSEEKKE